MSGHLSIYFEKNRLPKKEIVSFIRTVYRYIEERKLVELGKYDMYLDDWDTIKDVFIKFSKLSAIPFNDEHLRIIENHNFCLTVPVEKILGFDGQHETPSIGFCSNDLRNQDKLGFWFNFGRSDTYRLFQDNLANCKKLFGAFRDVIKQFSIEKASITFYETGYVWVPILYDKISGFKIVTKSEDGGESPLGFVKLKMPTL